ncbi:MAG: hypothetical protein ABJA81_10060 [Nocardioidaceae bacterium]
MIIWVALGVLAVVAVAILLWVLNGWENAELARAADVKRDEADRRFGDNGARGMGRFGP